MGSDPRERGNPPKRSYYTLAEASEVLGVHYETAARWVRSGKLPGVKISHRKVIVPKEKCRALLEGPSASTGSDRVPAGSPKWWLALTGTLTPKEADRIMAVVQECCEKVDEEA